MTSKVDAVTVFLESAQITRNKSIQLSKGTTLLKFVALSPFIDAKSIQVKSKDLEIQSVAFQKNFLKKNTKNLVVSAFKTSLTSNVTGFSTSLFEKVADPSNTRVNNKNTLFIIYRINAPLWS
ncbi:MAG: DUF4140 domain-containing protein [Polaribacter sp.]|nr:DUF4140 domain-containing protein [Polaribacter sp.]